MAAIPRVLVPEMPDLRELLCDFVGREALVRQKAQGVHRKLAGFEMRGRGIGRDGYEVLLDGVPAGWVTSGSPSPTLARHRQIPQRGLSYH